MIETLRIIAKELQGLRIKSAVLKLESDDLLIELASYALNGSLAVDSTLYGEVASYTTEGVTFYFTK